MARLPNGEQAPRIQDLQQETVVRLISEPTTLLPYLMETSARTVTTMAVGDETAAPKKSATSTPTDRRPTFLHWIEPAAAA